MTKRDLKRIEEKVDECGVTGLTEEEMIIYFDSRDQMDDDLAWIIDHVVWKYNIKYDHDADPEDVDWEKVVEEAGKKIGVETHGWGWYRELEE